MKFLQKQSPDPMGTVKLIPENPDDLWLASNLVSPGDHVTTVTSRKVQLPSGKANNPSRVRFPLELKVVSVDLSASSLRLQGKVQVANEYVRLGSFHTLELEVNKEFSLMKKVWDAGSMKKLEEFRLDAGSYELCVVLMDEKSACVILSGKLGSKRCDKIDRKPKTAQNKFFESLLIALLKHVDLGMVRCVAVGGPGVIKNDFRSFLMCQHKKLNCVVSVNTETGEWSSLDEVLIDKRVMGFVNIDEVARKAMEKFREVLLSDSEKACYGLKSVESAIEMRAIETLLITDELYRCREVNMRKKYAGLVESVKIDGGKAMVISCEELGKLTGIGAILRFPVPDLDDLVL